MLATLAFAHPAPLQAQSGEFPFARNEIPSSYPSVSVGFGVGWYVARFESVEGAFRAIERAYGAAGYPVPSSGGVDPGPIVMPSIHLQATRWLEVTLQAGRSVAMDSKLTLVGGLVSFPFARFPGGKASLVAGVGGGGYGFSFQKGYGARFTPPMPPDNGYDELETITLSGGGNYWTTTAGLSIRIGSEGAFHASVQYLDTGDITADDTRAGPVTVNMSGTMVVASLTMFLKSD